MFNGAKKRTKEELYKAIADKKTLINDAVEQKCSLKEVTRINHSGGVRNYIVSFAVGEDHSLGCELERIINAYLKDRNKSKIVSLEHHLRTLELDLSNAILYKLNDEDG